MEQWPKQKREVLVACCLLLSTKFKGRVVVIHTNIYKFICTILPPGLESRHTRGPIPPFQVPPPPILDVPNALKKECPQSEIVGRLCDLVVLVLRAVGCKMQLIDTHNPMHAHLWPMYAHISP